MKITKSNGEKNHVKLAIALEMTEWQGVLDKAAEKVSTTIKIDGFREGKAPRDVVIAKAGEARVISEAIELAVEQFYPSAVRQENLRPIAFPKISVEKGNLNEPLEFTAEVAVLPEVVLGDYSKIKLEKRVESVGDEQVEGVLKSLQKKAVEFQEVERVAQMGDWAEIDFDGFVDGKPFEGGASKKHPLILGDKVFIPGFEEGLVGLGKGEEKDVEVTFPADYHNKDLAGKKAMFKVKMNLVKAVNYPEINDEFAKKHAGQENLEVLKADIKKYLEEEATKKAEEGVRENALLELVKVAKIDLPEEMIEQELDSMVHDLKHQAEHSGMSFEDYLKKANVNEAGLKSQWREQAEQRVRIGLALEAFRDAEKIEATEEDVEAEMKKLKEIYPQDGENIEKEYGKNSNGRERLQRMLGSRKAIDRLVEMVTQ
ncbi:MAG: trigger factor [Patescibacteria group bacterium]